MARQPVAARPGQLELAPEPQQPADAAHQVPTPSPRCRPLEDPSPFFRPADRPHEVWRMVSARRVNGKIRIRSVRVRDTFALAARPRESRAPAARAAPPRRRQSRSASGQDPGDGDPPEPPPQTAPAGVEGGHGSVPGVAVLERSRALSGPSPRFSRPWRPHTEVALAERLAQLRSAAEPLQFSFNEAEAA